MSISDLKIGKIFNFNTKAPSILGTTIKNATLKSILDYASAMQYDNIDLKFRQIYPLLPQGTPDQPEACVYYRFISESGALVIFADQWIDEPTIEVVQHINFQVSFSNANVADMARVRDALNALGYTNYAMKQMF